MAEIIDMTLAQDAKRYLQKVLAKRGLNYFLQQDGVPFRIEKSKVDMVIRAVTRLRIEKAPRPHAMAIENARQEIRRELIRKVAESLLNLGL